MLLRQRFGALAAGRDGLIVVGVVGGKVAYVSSSLATDTTVTGARRLEADAAVRAAAADAGMLPSALSGRPRLVAVPTPADGVRRAWEVSLIDNGAEPRARRVVRRRRDRRGADPRGPRRPPRRQPDLDGVPELAAARLRVDRHARALVLARDGRTARSWSATRRRRSRGTSTRAPTGRRSRPRATTRSLSTTGSATDPFTVGTERATSRPDREYDYTWTNQWREQRCNPNTTFTSPQRNDIDAARANLFAMHNRMHDWSYYLGFTEARLEPAGEQLRQARRRGERPRVRQRPGRRRRRRPPGFAARDNANQITRDDGVAADHQHVPVAADRGRLLRAVRGRRLRHVGHRPRVHARHLQPHGRRPGRRTSTATRPARWARAGRT